MRKINAKLLNALNQNKIIVFLRDEGIFFFYMIVVVLFLSFLCGCIKLKKKQKSNTYTPIYIAYCSASNRLNINRKNEKYKS